MSIIGDIIYEQYLERREAEIKEIEALKGFFGTMYDTAINNVLEILEKNHLVNS